MENREPQQEQPTTPHPEAKLASVPDIAERQQEAAVHALDDPEKPPVPSAKDSDPAEWRNRVRLLAMDLRNWFVRNTYLPRWLPAPWRHPLLVYAAAVVVE